MRVPVSEKHKIEFYGFKIQQNIFVKISLCCLLIGFLQACSNTRRATKPESVNVAEIKSNVIIKKNVPARYIDVKNVNPEDLVKFAKTLLGVPYQYGSMKKENGLDCSGFVNYVFNHFKIAVPRTTVEFTNAGKVVSLRQSKIGDILLLTGSDAKSGIVGHMGIVTENKRNDFRFIHSASGGGVIISTFNSYFIPRFVKVIRIFP